MKKSVKNNLINLIIIILYALITFFIMLHHEPWRDEAQAWLLAKDLSFTNILEFSRYEGHPMLWHLILMPFAKLGFPYITLNIISWLLMVITAVLIIYKAPFNKFLKISILISSPFIYFYISISRVYSLIALLLILLAIIYKHKEKMPCTYGLLILLLANTHITMLGMVGMLILDFYIKNIFIAIKNKKLKENKKLLLGFGIAVIGIILVFLQLLGSISSNEQVMLVEPQNYIYTLEQYIILFVFSYTGKQNILLIIIIFIAIITIMFWQIITFKKHKNSILIFYGSIMFQILVYVMVYQYIEQTMLITYFVIMFCIWIAHYKEDNFKENLVLDIILIIISLITLLYSCKIIKSDFIYNYSSSKETAQFINNTIEKGSLIISTDDYTASSIIPYCKDYKFYNPQRRDIFTYVKWDEKRNANVSYEDLKDIIKEQQNNNKVYILTSKINLTDVINMFEAKNEILPIFYSNQSLKADEKYYLYEIDF